MKPFICLLCLFAAVGTKANLFVPSISTIGADIDTEIVMQEPVEPDSRVAIDIHLSNPSSSNTVLLAFGKDLNADGKLSTEEIKHQIGWDAGAWVKYSSNAVDSEPLQSGVSNNRLLKQLMAGDWDLMNLIVRGDASGKVFAGKPPTIIFIR